MCLTGSLNYLKDKYACVYRGKSQHFNCDLNSENESKNIVSIENFFENKTLTSRIESMKVLTHSLRYFQLLCENHNEKLQN